MSSSSRQDFSSLFCLEDCPPIVFLIAQRVLFVHLVGNSTFWFTFK
jgi:hypothetical protein